MGGTRFPGYRPDRPPLECRSSFRVAEWRKKSANQVHRIARFCARARLQLCRKRHKKSSIGGIAGRRFSGTRCCEPLTGGGSVCPLQMFRNMALEDNLVRLEIICDRCERLSSLQRHRPPITGNKGFPGHPARRFVAAFAFPHRLWPFGNPAE